MAKLEPRIIITREISNGALITKVPVEPRPIRGTTVATYFSDLLVNLFEDTPDLPIKETTAARGNAEYARQLAKRLRSALGSKDLVANGLKSYRLAVKPEEVEIDDGFWTTGRLLIDPKLLHRLFVAYKNFWSRYNASRCRNGLVIPSAIRACVPLNSRNEVNS